MKPEHRLDEHVERRPEVVASTYVAEFVFEDGLQFFGLEAIRDLFGKQEDRAEYPDDAGLRRVAETMTGTGESIIAGVDCLTTCFTCPQRSAHRASNSAVPSARMSCRARAKSKPLETMGANAAAGETSGATNRSRPMTGLSFEAGHSHCAPTMASSENGSRNFAEAANHNQKRTRARLR